jgi:hypothetical protein
VKALFYHTFNIGLGLVLNKQYPSTRYWLGHQGVTIPGFLFQYAQESFPMLRPDQHNGAATQASAGDLSASYPLCQRGALDDAGNISSAVQHHPSGCRP